MALMRVHVSPPFSDRKTPPLLLRRSSSGPNPAFVTLHDCHDDFWIAGADCQTNPASLPGKTAAEFFPGSAAVGALENSADIFAAGHARTGSETPRRSLARIQRCVNNLRIRRIERDIATTRMRVMRRRMRAGSISKSCPHQLF